MLAKAVYLANRCAACPGPFASKLAPTGSGLVRRFCEYPHPLWERACSRKRCIWQADVLNVPAPSQASLLPRILGCTQIRGSELAREGGVSGKQMCRMSRPLRRQACSHKYWVVLKSVGASLLAKAVYLASRCAECPGPFAGKLSPTNTGLYSNPWERACSRRRSVWQSRCAECPGPFAGKLAPTNTGLCSNPWERACSRRRSVWQSRCAKCPGPFASKVERHPGCSHRFCGVFKFS
ncbi:Uncharacterised protein [Paucimonas lemoignei]|nr:Uncharacterised protein [Paucimonas lemoignei]